jgi:4-diphosphocytidyl-2-C-methyl-D-erythritol kinase
MQLAAPAKINISFKIIGKRADGFHEIETLMSPISLSDQLTFNTTDSGRVEFDCDDPSLPGGSENLVVQAAEYFLAKLDFRRGVRIQLAKRIPHGAGLGGGSSDAATTLLALNRTLGENMTTEQLIEIGGAIGSDVPFFIAQTPAICRGRGEMVTPAKLRRKLSLLLAKPGFGVPTATAYASWKDSRELPAVTYAPQQFGDLTFVNVLERPVFQKYPFLARMKMWLIEQREVGAALLSGSGSTVFAALHEGIDAADLADRMRAALEPKLWTCAAETI